VDHTIQKDETRSYSRTLVSDKYNITLSRFSVLAHGIHEFIGLLS